MMPTKCLFEWDRMMSYTDREIRYLRQMETFRIGPSVRAVNEALLEDIAETIFEYGNEWGTITYRYDTAGRVLKYIHPKKVPRNAKDRKRILGRAKSREEKSAEFWLHWQKEILMKQARDAYEMPLPEGAEPNQIDTLAPPARDDFEQIKRTLLDSDGNVKPTKPVSLDPCPRCKSVHETDKNPICVCVKCLTLGRIVWCGYCVKCAWLEFSERFGEASGDAMFPQYGQWRKGEVERLKREGEPWETK